MIKTYQEETLLQSEFKGNIIDLKGDVEENIECGDELEEASLPEILLEKGYSW